MYEIMSVERRSLSHHRNDTKPRCERAGLQKDPAELNETLSPRSEPSPPGELRRAGLPNFPPCPQSLTWPHLLVSRPHPLSVLHASQAPAAPTCLLCPPPHSQLVPSGSWYSALLGTHGPDVLWLHLPVLRMGHPDPLCDCFSDRPYLHHGMRPFLKTRLIIYSLTCLLALFSSKA